MQGYIQIEFCDHEQCSRLFFYPLHRVVRSRLMSSVYTAYDISERMRSFFRKFREVPGESVWVDFSRAKSSQGVLAVMGSVDLLSVHPQRDEIVRFYKDNFMSLGGGSAAGEITFPKTTEREIKKHDELKDLLYWMRRAVDDGKAVVCPKSSSLPTMDKIIAMPGRRSVPGMANTVDKETREILSEYDFYVDPATVKGGTKAGSGSSSSER